jgi:ribosomal peptide maturation radical SAM protein 1
MNFRSKPAAQVLDMLQSLSRKYGRFHFNAIDNIMETDYITNLFEPLAEARADLSIHYEVRPHFSREQLGRMRQGGLISVQPGIESLSTHVLKLMKKHGTGIKNISFLKWCVYYGINNLYNILFGFAGETAEDYIQQNELVDKLQHLQPPYGITNARPDRGSPMFTDPEQHAIHKIVPNSCYEYIYPEDQFEIPKVAYFFEHDMTDLPDRSVYSQLVRSVLAWKERWYQRPRPFLQYRKSWNTVRVEDGRRDGNHKVHMYTDNEADLFEFCDEPRNMRAITKKFGDEPWVQRALDEMVAADVFLHMDKHYLNLSLPTNQYH